MNRLRTVFSVTSLSVLITAMGCGAAFGAQEAIDIPFSHPVSSGWQSIDYTPKAPYHDPEDIAVGAYEQLPEKYFPDAKGLPDLKDQGNRE